MGFDLDEVIFERIAKEVEYICEYGYTLREVAKLVGVCKSTVHKDVTIRLKRCSKKEYLKVKKVLGNHLATRHLRGGEATKIRYEKLKQEKN